MDDVHLQDHIHVHEISQCLVVGDYPADLGGGEEHIFRPLGLEKGLHGTLVAEVKLSVSPQDKVVVALPAQLTDDRRPYHPAVAGDIDLGVLLHHFTMPFSRYSTRFILRTSSAAPSAATLRMSCSTMMRTSSSKVVF